MAEGLHVYKAIEVLSQRPSFSAFMRRLLT